MRLQQKEKGTLGQFSGYDRVLACCHSDLSCDNSADRELERGMDYLGNRSGAVPGGDCRCECD